MNHHVTSVIKNCCARCGIPQHSFDRKVCSFRKMRPVGAVFWIVPVRHGKPWRGKKG